MDVGSNAIYSPEKDGTELALDSLELIVANETEIVHQ